MGSQETHKAICVSTEIAQSTETVENESVAKRRRLEGRMVAERNSTATVPEKKLSQGAEGIVTLMTYLGRAAVRKERVTKRYRHPELDLKLRSRRMAQEARILLRLRKAGLPVPAVYDVDTRRGKLVMQFVHGTTLKAFLHSDGMTHADGIMRTAGHLVARMHKADVVHGDLTTGNVMVDASDSHETVWLIDFGLSHGNGSEEDMAVDLYVFERAVISAHSERAQFLNDAFLQEYAQTLRRPAVMSRLEEVRARGRKRDMTG